MKRTAFVSSFSAALLLAASPAAADPLHGAAFDRQTGAFAGGTLRLQFGPSASRAPAARLNLGFEHSYRDASGAVTRRVQPPGLELGLRGGRPELFVSGQSLRDVERRLGAGPGAAILVIGGVALGGAAVAMLGSGGGERPSPCPPGVEVCTQ